MLHTKRSSTVVSALAACLLAAPMLTAGAFTLLSAGPAVAQETSEGEPAAESLDNEASGSEAVDAEAEQAAYQAAIEEWKTSIAQMQAAALRFHNGTQETEQKYLTEYRELSERGRGEFNRAIRAATRLLQHDPKADSEYASFLLAAVRYRFDRDWYELTGEAAEALMAAEVAEPRLPEIAGVSFWATNRFDRAAEHLQTAIDNGFIEPKHRRLLESVSVYKPLWEREQQLRQESHEQDDLPQVRITTTRGDLIVELFEDQAPNTVANFISLAEQGFYDGLAFHQVIPSQIAMTGDPVGDSSGNAGYRLADETAHDDARASFRGSLVMAKLADPRSNSGQTIPDSASSQFFFTFMPLPWVNREHTVFGRVIENIGTLSALTRVDPAAKKEEAEPEGTQDRILSMELIRKRPHGYQPKVLESLNAER